VRARGGRLLRPPANGSENAPESGEFEGEAQPPDQTDQR
jgi:hypothetical protein